MTPTLGWEVARWLHHHLPSPADAREPFTLTSGQLDFVLEFYALDERSEFLYRRAALVKAKGWGKSPLAAALALAEFTGPVVFDRWAANGEPVGRPWDNPLVQIAALSEEQADSTVYALCRDLLVANDGKAASALGVDAGRDRLYLNGRPGKLEAVTTAAGSREGQRLTFANLDETHLMTKRNGGQRLARTLRRNAAKMGGRTLETSNAPELGLGSVAEATMADYAAGEAGILLAASDLPAMPEPTMSDDALRPLIAAAYQDASWVNRERILSEIRDPATPWDEAIRYYLNAPSAARSVLVDPARWAQLIRPAAVIPDGARVGVGFDGSHAYDGTAVVICSEDGTLSLELLVERDYNDPPDWTVPRQQVHDVVDDLFARFEVTRMLCDPYFWRSEIDAWKRQHGDERVFEYPTNSVRRFGPAVDRFRAAITTGSVGHPTDPDLTRHMLNARLVRGGGRAQDDGHALYTLEKPGPGRLIDAAVAAILSFEAMAMTAPAVELEPWFELVTR